MDILKYLELNMPKIWIFNCLNGNFDASLIFQG